MGAIHRRDFLRRVVATGTAGVVINRTGEQRLYAQKGAGKRSKKGEDFSAIRPLMESFIQEHKIAGASLTVARHGQIVSSHGYGLAVVAAMKPVTQETLFSIASVTKAITGVATLKLIDDGKLKLEDRLMKLLADIGPDRGTKPADPRFSKLTVHHLLYHGGGFPNVVKIPSDNSTAAGDDDADDDADHPDQLYRALLKLPLEFDPGTQHKYSNNGFVVLRLVIEHASGQSYETYCRERILAPLGIQGMHLEQHTDYESNETHRYRAGGEKPAPRNVANWLATSADLVQFASAVAGSGKKSILSEALLRKMLERPPELKGEQNNKGPHVGLGWDAAEQLPDGTFHFSKNGGKPGVQAWLEHLPSGIDWALMFNTSSPKDGPNSMTQARKLLKSKFDELLG